jgi:CheY-like chemotaxis protein
VSSVKEKYVVSQEGPPAEAVAPAPALFILIVEDNRDIRESARMVLEYLGHRVAVAVDGLDGIEQALALRPRVALVDIGLPRLDGYSVARCLRAALGRDIVLVAYTAYGGPEDRALALEAGFDLHLVKPVDWALFAPWLSGLAGEASPDAALPRRPPPPAR